MWTTTALAIYTFFLREEGGGKNQRFSSYLRIQTTRFAKYRHWQQKSITISISRSSTIQKLNFKIWGCYVFFICDDTTIQSSKINIWSIENLKRNLTLVFCWCSKVRIDTTGKKNIWYFEASAGAGLVAQVNFLCARVRLCCLMRRRFCVALKCVTKTL